MRIHIAAVLYPIFHSVLFGAGVVATAVLVEGGQQQWSALVKCALVAFVLAAPLAWEAAPLLVSKRERANMDGDGLGPT